MLPGRDGWEITRNVRGDAALAGIPIIMLTARVEDTERIVGLELGADDYITKPFNPREVVARVRAVLRRIGGANQPHVLVVGSLRMDLDRHEVTRAGRVIELTPTEYELLRAFMEHPGRAFTRLELIEQALGYSFEGYDRAVDSHIKNLRKKLEPEPSDPAYVQTVYGVGYRLEEA
jgi:two-component system alkaline phosphatase synthesis response regulator PhoP